MEERAKVYPQLKQKNSRKGFTLVELIVVLVIIAILAAVAIPALLGYTDEAKEKQAITEAKAALNAAESMLSDAYTDGRKTLTIDVREKCYQTSGLDYDTEFTVWTVDSMQKADGTYKTTKSYTINKALYKTKDGVYVYYDSTYDSTNTKEEWRVLDSTDSNDQALINKNDGNIIYVWHFPSSTHTTDTAIDSQYAAGNDDINEEPEDEVDNHKGSLGPEYDKDPDLGGGEQDDSEYTISVTLIGSVGTTFSGNSITALGFDNGSATVSDEGLPSLTVEYTKQGFSEAPVLDVSPLYDDSKLTWTSSDSIPWSEGTISSSSDISSYLSELYTAYDQDVSVTLTSSIDEKTCEIPVAFIACSESTQNVEVNSSNAENKISDDNNLKDTVFYEFGLVSGEIDTTDSKYVNVTTAGTVTVNRAATAPAEAVVYNNDWVPGFYSDKLEYFGDDYSISDDEYFYTNLSGVESWVKGYIEKEVTELDLSGENADNVVDTFISNTGEGGITFVATADVYKTVYLVGKEENTVEFKNNVTNELIPSYDETFAKNELSSDIYVVNNGTKSTVPIDDNYSILGSADLSLNIKNSEKFKIWDIYDCSKTGEKQDGEVDKQTRDVDEVLDRLYTEDEDFGELCEVDVALLTTLLANTNGNDTTTTPLSGLFASLGADSSTETIEYIGFDERSSYGYGAGVDEVCLSTTKLSGTPLVPDDGKVTVSTWDYDYPAYTVAFTADNGQHIYVFTEDDTQMKAIDSLKGLHSGLSSMTTNSFVENIDASEVTNLESMFDGCSVLANGTSDGTLNLNQFSSAGIISAENMFYGCAALENVSLGGFGEASVLTSTKSMFDGCGALSSLAIDAFDTSNVEDMSSMFKGCDDLTRIGTGSSYTLQINSATTIKDIFNGCTNLETVSISGGGSLGNPCPIVEDNMTGMFAGCESLATVKVQNSVFSKLSVLKFVFQSDKENLENSYLINTKINGSTSLSGLFDGCSSLSVATFDDDSTQHVTDMSGMFKGCSALVNGNDASVEADPACLLGLNVTSATNMTSMFENCTGLLSTAVGFDTSNATDLTGMFKGCSGLLDAKVRIDSTTSVKELFNNCTSLDKVVLCGGSTDVEAALGNGSSYDNCFTGAGKLVGPDNNIRNIDITLENITFPNFKFRGKEVENLTRDDKCAADNKGKNIGLYKLFNSARANAHSITIQNVTFTHMYSMDFVFGWDLDKTYNATTINKEGFKELENITFNNVSAPQLGRMKGLFSNNPKLKTVTLNKFEIPKAWNYSFMFCNDTQLQTVTLIDFTAAGTTADYFTDYSAMFKDCRVLTTIDGLENFDTSNARDMKYMFANCFNIGNGTLDISNFDTHNVRTDKVEKTLPGQTKPQESKNEASGFLHMFGTVNNNGDDTTQYESNLKTIIVSDEFVVNWDINTKFNEMFGSGLVHLNEDGGTMIGTNKVSGKNNKDKYFAWKDGKKREDRADKDSQGYFKGIEDKKYAKLVEMGSDWPCTSGFKLVTGLGTAAQKNSIIGFSRSTKTKEEVMQIVSQKGLSSKSMAVSESSFTGEGGTDMHGNTYAQYVDEEGNPYPVYFWAESTTGGSIIYWWSEVDVVYMNSDSSSLFSSWKKATTINLEGLDFSEMSHFSLMFKDCEKLKTISGFSLNGAVASNNTAPGLSQMFYNCQSLTSIDLSGLDTTAVTSLKETFYGCENLVAVSGLDGFNTQNVTTMEGMFQGCDAVTVLDLSSFNFDKVNNTTQMFYNCKSLTTIYASNSESPRNVSSTGVNIPYIDKDYDMFDGCSNLKGDKGTEYWDSILNVRGKGKAYAHLDGGDSNPGYFSVKE